MKTASKITPEQAAEARRRYEAGESVAQIRHALGLSYFVALRWAAPALYAEELARQRERKGKRRRGEIVETRRRQRPYAVSHALDAVKSTWTADVGQPWIEDRRVLRLAPGQKAPKPTRRTKPEPPPELRGVSDALRLYELRTAREFAARMASIRTVLSDEALQAIASTEDTE